MNMDNFHINKYIFLFLKYTYSSRHKLTPQVYLLSFLHDINLLLKFIPRQLSILRPHGLYHSACLLKIPVLELKEDGMLRFSWAARMNPASSKNLCQAAKPTLRLDDTPQVSIPSQVLSIGPDNKKEVETEKEHAQFTVASDQEEIVQVEKSGTETQYGVELKDHSTPPSCFKHSPVTISTCFSRLYLH
ncbi:unnamed protein product [Brassica oleracea var. botrytis]